MSSLESSERTATNLEDTSFADLLQVEHLNPTLSAGDDDVAREARMEGDGREWAQEASVVQLEIWIGKGKPLPARGGLVSRRRGARRAGLDSPHGVADCDDVVALCLDLTDASGMSEDTLSDRQLGGAGIEKYERAGNGRCDELSRPSQVQKRDWRRLLLRRGGRKGEGRQDAQPAQRERARLRTRLTIEPRFTLTMKRSLPGPVAMISEEREGV
jgi:hypothetical protein